MAGLAMAWARGLDREAWLVLAGDGSERESLVRASAALGISDRVRFLGYQNRPWEVYPGFDYFVMPSTREGLPFALLEAMACGCPGIAMDVGGVSEVIAGPELGWLVPAGDEDRFHEAMLAAAHTRVEERDRRARRVRSHVQAHFSDQFCFARLASIIEGGELVEVSATSRTERA
jgi:glycosyltransferase involved in cell wall biosynthesis